MHKTEKPARKYIYKMWTQEKFFHVEESFFKKDSLFIFQCRRSVLLENK